MTTKPLLPTEATTPLPLEGTSAVVKLGCGILEEHADSLLPPELAPLNNAPKLNPCSFVTELTAGLWRVRRHRPD